MNHSQDLAAEAFLALRSTFFDTEGDPVSFHLREKGYPQDDPLDEYIAGVLEHHMPRVACEKGSPLVSPDIVLFRPERCNGQPRDLLANDASRIAALEVKKLERTKTGRIARASGLDYNTTPPCGKVRIYDQDELPLDVRGFYVFVAQEEVAHQEYVLSALTVCDGNILNADFELYLSIVGPREKDIGLGTYGNGANRVRPMFIFSNPLGASELDRHATLVAPQLDDGRLTLVYRILRTKVGGDSAEFHAYRWHRDVPKGWEVQTLENPFPTPQNRTTTTQTRGRFRVPIKPA